MIVITEKLFNRSKAILEMASVVTVRNEFLCLVQEDGGESHLGRCNVLKLRDGSLLIEQAGEGGV